MSISPILTTPVARAMGLVSCMRLRQRTNVDLPQPEGPISAVAWFAGMCSEMSCSVCVEPYHAFRFSTWMPTPTLVISFEHSSARDDAYQRDGDHDQRDEHECARPCQPVPLVIGRNCIHK